MAQPGHAEVIARTLAKDREADLQTITFQFGYKWYCGAASVAAGTYTQMPFKVLRVFDPRSTYRITAVRYNAQFSGLVHNSTITPPAVPLNLQGLLGLGFSGASAPYQAPGVPGTLILNQLVTGVSVNSYSAVNGIADGFLNFTPKSFTLPVGKAVYLVAQSNVWYGEANGSVTLYLQETFEQ